MAVEINLKQPVSVERDGNLLYLHDAQSSVRLTFGSMPDLKRFLLQLTAAVVGNEMAQIVMGNGPERPARAWLREQEALGNLKR